MAGRKTKITEEQKKMLAEYWLTSMTIEELSGTIGLHIVTLRRAAFKMGLPSKRTPLSYKKHPISYPKETRDKLIAAVSRGLSLVAASEEVGCSIE